MASYRFVVMSNPVEGREDEYNNWYDSIHLDDVLRVPGFTAATRYDYVDTVSGEPPAHRHLAIYDIETDDLAATFAPFLTMSETGEMVISDAMATDVSARIYRLRERSPKPS